MQLARMQCTFHAIGARPFAAWTIAYLKRPQAHLRFGHFWLAQGTVRGPLEQLHSGPQNRGLYFLFGYFSYF